MWFKSRENTANYKLLSLPLPNCHFVTWSCYVTGCRDIYADQLRSHGRRDHLRPSRPPPPPSAASATSAAASATTSTIRGLRNHPQNCSHLGHAVCGHFEVRWPFTNFSGGFGLILYSEITQNGYYHGRT